MSCICEVDRRLDSACDLVARCAMELDRTPDDRETMKKSLLAMMLEARGDHSGADLTRAEVFARFTPRRKESDYEQQREGDPRPDPR
jgi:hypothetical protein